MNHKIFSFEDFQFFFDLKLSLIRDIEKLEKEIYCSSIQLDEIQLKAQKLSFISQKHNHQYFKIKLHSLLLQLEKLKSKKGYKKLEFDRLYSLLSKLKESEKVEFLNEVIQKKIEKIAKTQLESKKQVLNIPDRENKYYLLSFQRVLYIIKSLPKRILSDVKYSQKNIVYKNKKFPVFPTQPLVLDDGKSSSKLMIVRDKKEFLGIRYDFLDTIVEFSREELEERSFPIEKPISSISKFIKWKGQRCYLIDFGLNVSK
jgi:hypothetical protein